MRMRSRWGERYHFVLFWFFPFLSFWRKNADLLSIGLPCTANGSLLFSSPQVFLTPKTADLPGDCARLFILSSIPFSFEGEELWPSIYPFLSFCSFFQSWSSLGAIQSQCLRAISHALNWGIWQKSCDSVISWATGPLIICLWELCWQGEA